jgi:hypothetical protein
MHRPPLDNSLNLSDRAQVRTIRRKLRLSEAELTALVDKIGNSIAAINKEVSVRRASRLARR